MKICILKNEMEKICFKIDDDDALEFNYDNFEKLIDKVYDNDEIIDFVYDEEFVEYQQLLNSIIIETRKKDFRDAVKEADDTNEELKTEEKSLDVNI